MNTKQSQDAINLITNKKVKILLSETINYDFNIFKLKDETQSDELFALAYYLMQKHSLLESIDMDEFKFVHFIRDVSNGYKGVPYHNKMHAADVT